MRHLLRCAQTRAMMCKCGAKASICWFLEPEPCMMKRGFFSCSTTTPTDVPPAKRRSARRATPGAACSGYGDDAIARFGLWAGGWMTLARLLRCQPWGTSCLDFVVKHKPTTARWYLPLRYARWRGVNDKPE